MNNLLESKLEKARSEIAKACETMTGAYDAFIDFVPSEDDKKDWHEAGKLLAVLSISVALLRVPIEQACKQFIPELQTDEYHDADPEKRFLILLFHSIYS